MADKHFIDDFLFDNDEDGDDLFYKHLIRDFITGATPPAAAAAELDHWITDEARTRRSELDYHPRRWARKKFEQNPDDWSHVPRTDAHIDDLFRYGIIPILKACPPKSPEQVRLLAFLNALRDMPRHCAPYYNRWHQVHSDDTCQEIELWPFGENWMCLVELIRRESDGLGGSPYPGVDAFPAAIRARWENFNSAIAQLTAQELFDCSFLSALRNLLPSNHYYPDLDKYKVGGPYRIRFELLAASHWVLDDVVGAWVYAQCRKVETTDPKEYRDTWSMENWRTWKCQMEFIGEDGRFAEDTRELARTMGTKLVELETRGSGE